MKRKKLLIGVLCVFVLSGCSIKPMMSRVDMHVIPDINQAPENSILISAQQNSRLLIAEGIQDSVTWPVNTYDKAGKAHPFRAVNPAQKSNRLRLDIFCPSLNKDDVQYVVVFDRLGKTAYNSVGRGMVIKDWKEFKPADYKDFFLVDSANIKQVNRGSQDFLELVAEYKQAFQQVGGDKLAKVVLKYKSEFEKYDWNMPEWRIKQIVKEDSNVQALVDILLYKGWYAYATWPFIGAHETAIVAGIAKLFQIPAIFNDKIDLPGYGTYMPSANDVAEMVEIGFQIHGMGGRTMPSGKTPLTAEQKTLIYGTPCTGFEFYEDYATCVFKYNADVEKRNEARRAAKAAKVEQK
ncbi:MAG: hypothetical protein AUJ36_03955 [Parcubacteria group bacterium CG1_02_41_26]|nr:MAG: hypothetical protein AUJ36_03955 [Parcubacteria group bacterium CG1_02_41_26]